MAICPECQVKHPHFLPVEKAAFDPLANLRIREETRPKKGQRRAFDPYASACEAAEIR